MLNRVHRQALPFTLAAFDEEVIKALNIEKQVPSPVEVLNVTDADATPVGHITPIQTAVRDMLIKFCGYPFQSDKRSNRRCTVAGGGRRSMAARTGVASNHGQTGGLKVVLKEEPEEVVVNFFYIAPPDSLMLDKPKKGVYEVLKEVTKQYYLVYNIALKFVVEVQEESTTEDFTESVDLFLMEPPYTIRREANRDNSDNDIVNSE